MSYLSDFRFCSEAKRCIAPVYLLIFLSQVINKGLTDADLLRGVQTAFEQGWNAVKLYFMIGLPGETDDDVLGIAETVKWLQSRCRAKGRKRLAISLTVSSFTPKPFTPFQVSLLSTLHPLILQS